MPFGEAFQQLWLFFITTFIESSRVLPIPLTLAPIRLVLAEPSFPHGSNGNFGLRVHCQRAFYPLRVLLMEQQVLYFSPFSVNYCLDRIVSHSPTEEGLIRYFCFFINAPR
jgi:hypothetical protein